jgi:hypothetical protein
MKRKKIYISGKITGGPFMKHLFLLLALTFSVHSPCVAEAQSDASLHNPLCIRNSDDIFAGEVLPPSGKLKRFQTEAHGYRAAFVILGTYLSRGHDTIEKILHRWAPANENNTEEYIIYVSRQAGVARNAVLTASDGEACMRIVYAMSVKESGRADVIEIRAGFDMQEKIQLKIQN